MSVGECACTYACLILHDDGITITAEKIVELLRAENVSVESYWPGLFAKLCEKKNLDELIMNIGAAATDEKSVRLKRFRNGMFAPVVCCENSKVGQFGCC
ncbi:60S acidic ribosomal protein P1 [Artemisia annua]|uniref:60S acidic ribosomal protein P1 n=1 Tax=Artemisia annua TaxID=35608 RepID=A0A2U1K8V3_ARTAN|nr:60S acidic ribosomal protein P1 [Artemisia annua]